MPHKTGFLSGDEPQEIEEKTEAQKIDERRPAAMAASRSMFEAAENDDTPAIEQKIANQDIIGEHKEDNQPKFEIDSFFEQEMKTRMAEERTARAKREEAQKEQAKQVARIRKEAVKKELEHAQTLDEEELRDKIAEETSRSNLQKLYPDAKPLTTDVEDELWRQRTGNGRKASERAKIESVYDANLSKTITLSFVMQLVGVIILASTLFGQLKGLIAALIHLAGIAVIFSSAVLLALQCEKCKNRTIPFDQRTKFTLATVIPGLALRFICIDIFAKVPITGPYICYIAGAAVGASVHYQITNRYKIYVSITNTAINTLAYAIVCLLELLPLFTATSTSGAGIPIASSAFAALGIFSIVINVAEFFLGDLAAVRLALLTNK